MHALRFGEDATVEDRAAGTENPLQRVRGEVQVGASGAGVQAGSEPDIRAKPALQLPQEGDGAAAAEGAAATATTAAA